MSVRKHLIGRNAAQNLTAVISLVTASGLISHQPTNVGLALFAGFCSVYASTMPALKSAYKYDVMETIFRVAEKQYKALAKYLLPLKKSSFLLLLKTSVIRDLVFFIAEREAQASRFTPPPLPLNPEP